MTSLSLEWEPKLTPTTFARNGGTKSHGPSVRQRSHSSDRGVITYLGRKQIARKKLPIETQKPKRTLNRVSPAGTAPGGIGKHAVEEHWIELAGGRMRY